MGNSQTKDKNIDIYIQTEKQIYTGGQFVQGAVYLNAKENCLYERLLVKFRGQQKAIFYIDRNTAVTLNYTKIDTYGKSITINKFSQNTIQKGNYSFPFRFLLPESLPGSFCQSYKQNQEKLKFNQKNQIYIRYILTAQLVPSKLNPQQLKQTYSQFINIRQPLRNSNDLAENSISVEPTCCGFKNSGKTCINFKINKNLIIPEDQIQITLLVNNKQGKKNVNNFRINFQQHKYIVGSRSAVEKIIDKQINIHKLQKEVQAGKQETITFKTKVPKNFSRFSTSIGRTLGKYFTFNLFADIGLVQQFMCEIPVVFHSQIPYKQKILQVVSPKDWNPITFDKFEYHEMPPYIFRQSKQIPNNNRSTYTSTLPSNSISLEQMMNFSYNSEAPHQDSASTFDQNARDI